MFPTYDIYEISLDLKVCFKVLFFLTKSPQESSLWHKRIKRDADGFYRELAGVEVPGQVGDDQCLVR